MVNAQTLFAKRSNDNRAEVLRYSRFIFNGHFILFLSIAFGALMLQYAELLKHLPKGINYHLIIALLLSLGGIAPLRTYFKEADQVFLLAYERQLKDYVKKSIRAAFIKHAVIWSLFFALLYPLYHAGAHFYFIGMIGAYLFGVAAILLGLLVRWSAMKLGISNLSVNILLFIILMAGIYNSLEGVYFTALTELLFLGGLLYLMNSIAKNYVFKWDDIIDYEQELTQRQYKTINMFTDVKGLKDNVRRRRFLDGLLKQPAADYNHEGMFLYLFKRNFARSKDAFWIIIRLVVIGGIVIWLVRQPVIAVIIGIFIVYIIVLQSSQFYKQQAYQLWPQVWPVREQLVMDGFRKFLWQLSLSAALLIALLYIACYPGHFYYAVLFFVIMWWTNQQVMGKLKKKMTLLKD
ncbi:ABC transporter permease [Macrococcus equipercicus]|uniref:ABC transporter permease n=1 Tax=Macrococcus equipercicus TaxID=69967 RepID=A0ABQ6R7T7_9STAP|nr:ABC transporter permease [Macrococcus equipercicus]KAA1039161.1 ABC transporter permease [Macrococcus equipercicus]